MIALTCLDERLRHGQVSVGWVPHRRATVGVVANDRIAADPLLSGICTRIWSGITEKLPEQKRGFLAPAAANGGLLFFFRPGSCAW